MAQLDAIGVGDSLAVSEAGPSAEWFDAAIAAFVRPSASLRVPGDGVHPIAGHPCVNVRSLPESSPYER